MLVAAFVTLTGDPSSALVAAAVATFAGTIVIARLPVMRHWQRHDTADSARGLGPLRVDGFPALLLCAVALGVAFGAAGVVVPAYANQHGGGESLGGALPGIWALGSAVGGIWFGTRRPAMALPRQFAWLLVAVAASFAVLALMPNMLCLGVALVLGGATIAPALTVESTLVGRLAPASMLNEAYTWVITVTVVGTAVGGAVAGTIVDRPGGLPWAFLFAATVVAAAVLVAAWPSGPIKRADSAAVFAGEPRPAPLPSGDRE